MTDTTDFNDPWKPPKRKPILDFILPEVKSTTSRVPGVDWFAFALSAAAFILALIIMFIGVFIVNYQVRVVCYRLLRRFSITRKLSEDGWEQRMMKAKFKIAMNREVLLVRLKQEAQKRGEYW